MSSSEFTDNEKTVFLWVSLWIATFVHAGLTVLSMFFTVHLPPEYQVPPRWLDIFALWPNFISFGLYIIVLGIYIDWESRFKGSKTYIPSNYPISNIKSGEVAVCLWGVLWLLARIGHFLGFFSVPNLVGATFVTCFFLLVFQVMRMERVRKSEEIEDTPEAVKTVAVISKGMSPNPQNNLAVNKPTPILEAPENDDLTSKVLDYVRRNGEVKTSGLVGVLGSSRRTVIRNLNKLIEEGRLVRDGSGPGAVYRLNNVPKGERWN